MTSLWLRKPTLLAPSSPSKREIGRKPLIDLSALQKAINDGLLGKDDVWLATDSCEKELQKLTWSVSHLLDCIRHLKPFDARGNHDFRKSEWCLDSFGNWCPCDVYVIPYDGGRQCRDKQGLEHYLKFSIQEDGSLTLVMIRVHLSR